jgi:hypothetical protein
MKNNIPGLLLHLALLSASRAVSLLDCRQHQSIVRIFHVSLSKSTKFICFLPASLLWVIQSQVRKHEGVQLTVGRAVIVAVVAVLVVINVLNNRLVLLGHFVKIVLVPSCEDLGLKKQQRTKICPYFYPAICQK